MSTQRYWREIPKRYRLEAGKCEKCGKVYFPARQICPECKGTSMIQTNLPSEGKVLTTTVINVAPAQWRKLVPYAMGIVELDNGTRITTQIVDCDPQDVKIGMRVRLEFRRIQEDGPSGTIAYGYKAVPAT